MRRTRLILESTPHEGPQFTTDPLSSTHQFNIRTTPFQPQKFASWRRQIRQVNTKNVKLTHLSVQHQKIVRSTQNTVQHKNSCIRIIYHWEWLTRYGSPVTSAIVVLKRAIFVVFCVELTLFCVELTLFRYWTGECVELTLFMCWTDAFLWWIDGFWGL